jgi:hypothetical protein
MATNSVAMLHKLPSFRATFFFPKTESASSDSLFQDVHIRPLRKPQSAMQRSNVRGGSRTATGGRELALAVEEPNTQAK